MTGPSLRTVAVAAGFLGVTMIVAGTATAMVGEPSAAPVATAVALTQEDPASETPEVAADSTAAAPVEVGTAALECTADGSCDAGAVTVEKVEPEPAVATEARTDEADEPREASPVEGAESCEWPERPALPGDDSDRAAWKQEMQDWFEDVAAASRECGLEPRAWREALGEDRWQDLEWCRQAQESGDWSGWGHREWAEGWRDAEAPSDGAHDAWREHAERRWADRPPAGWGDREGGWSKREGGWSGEADARWGRGGR